MTANDKDRAILSASSLVGFCHSALSLQVVCNDEDEKERLDRWITGLIKYAQRTEALIDKALEPTDGETK